MTKLNLVEVVEITIVRKSRESLPAEVQRFCKAYDVKLVKADFTYERGFREPIYFFSDDLGGYTIEGIRKSLE